MGRGDHEEYLRFSMDFIKESHGSKRYLMAGITIRNGPDRPEYLDLQLLPCYKDIVCPGESRAPPPKGSSFGSWWLP
jgi:hypothetical protein